jgi:hypothetical protein
MERPLRVLIVGMMCLATTYGLWQFINFGADLMTTDMQIGFLIGMFWILGLLLLHKWFSERGDKALARTE